MGDRVLVDVNALAIYLVEDHPGHPYIEKELEPGLEGKRELLIFDYLPLRVHWVLTSKWRLPEAATRQAISSFLEQPVTMISGDAETTKVTYRIAEEKRHDVFDCFYIALARKEGAHKLLTTDTDFRRLCQGEQFEYLNPVPRRVLAAFGRGTTE